MRSLSFLVLILFFNGCHTSTVHDEKVVLSKLVEGHYNRYREPAIENRFIKHSEMLELIQSHEERGLFHNEIIGESVLGRSIHHLQLGAGKTKVLMWSQMHGDESTATMALFDLFNFFLARDEHDELRDLILSELEIHIVPMLNPDGAEIWQRRNAMTIDINRDARLQATPEGRALMTLAREVQPEFGFNLHDQSIYYAAGATPRPASVSFLAPAFNEDRDMNETRARATQVILAMNEVLQEEIPGQVARYDDTYDPRCFGDTFQGMGISTILIESGGMHGDAEKQGIRRLNFNAILRALESIARGDYTAHDIAVYDTIPKNRRSLYDLVVYNVRVADSTAAYPIHLAINRRQRMTDNYRRATYRGVIEDIGDLNKHYGYNEIDARNLAYAPGRVKKLTRSEWNSLDRKAELRLLRQGYLYVQISGREDAIADSERLLRAVADDYAPARVPRPGILADFLLKDGDSVRYAVVNGEVVEL